MLLYLIRHAEADLTTHHAYHTMPGPPLTEEGARQAEDAARILEPCDIGRVASSPMRRCTQTAEPLCRLLGLEIRTDEDLREMQPGEPAAGIAVRMLRAALTHTGAPAVALVSHAAPLEELLKALTLGNIALSPPDSRGAHIGVAHVWQVRHADGLWRARHLPVGGVLV